MTPLGVLAKRNDNSGAKGVGKCKLNTISIRKEKIAFQTELKF